MKRIRLVIVAVLLLVAAHKSHAAYIPYGLNPGDTYQLAFVTHTSRDATSANIADYNAFVQAAGDSSLLTAGVTWYAIASTADMDARFNALVSAPVYVVLSSLSGSQKVADGYTDMWRARYRLLQHLESPSTSHRNHFQPHRTLVLAGAR